MGFESPSLRRIGNKEPRVPLDRSRVDGWLLVAARGSQRQFKHPAKPGRVTVAGKPGDDLALGTLNRILQQAGLT